MSFLATVQFSSATSGSQSITQTAVNVSGFPVSGLQDANGIICFMYAYNVASQSWTPYTQ